MRPFSWESIWKPEITPWEVSFRAAVVYLFLAIVFRLLPRTELARISPLDIILLTLVTVAMRRAVVVDDNSLTTAFVGLTTIVVINLALHAITRISHAWSDRIQGRRLLLVKDGMVLTGGLQAAKVTEDELLSRLRGYGTQDVSRVDSAFMERDGKITFVFRDDGSHR